MQVTKTTTTKQRLYVKRRRCNLCIRCNKRTAKGRSRCTKHCIEEAARQKVWRDANPKRARAGDKRYRERNREKVNARSAAWRKRYPDRHKASKRRCNLKRAFNLTPEEFSKLLRKQKGVCAICKQPERHQRTGLYTLSVDHCHQTHRVRGLLCNRCNRAIGLLHDDPKVCLIAAKYLAK